LLLVHDKWILLDVRTMDSAPVLTHREREPECTLLRSR
jgi:hypothetical protein